jgi:nitrate/nitrite-specific signal transduction histidine kinase
MLNNVIDHSVAANVSIRCDHNDLQTEFEIIDDGIGVFEKLKSHFDLASDVHALMELVKGSSPWL